MCVCVCVTGMVDIDWGVGLCLGVVGSSVGLYVCVSASVGGHLSVWVWVWVCVGI